MIEALNKIDALPAEQRRILQTRTAAGPQRARQFAVSALSGEGVDQLLEAIEAFLNRQAEASEVAVPLSDGATIAWLYRHGDVRSRHDDDEIAHLTVALDEAARAQLERRLAR
jgi:GTP-binding protein HflX